MNNILEATLQIKDKIIIGDSTTHTLVDVVRDRKSYSLKQYFHCFEPKTRLKVKNTCTYRTFN